MFPLELGGLHYRDCVLREVIVVHPRLSRSKFRPIRNGVKPLRGSNISRSARGRPLRYECCETTLRNSEWFWCIIRCQKLLPMHSNGIISVSLEHAKATC